METVITNPLAVTAPVGTESAGDLGVSKATQLVGFISGQVRYALSGLERALEFLGSDYVQPKMSDPVKGLASLREVFAARPEQSQAVGEDAKRFRFEAFEASFDSLMQRVEAEIAEAERYEMLSSLLNRLEGLANEARVHWQSGRRELAINALRFALTVSERAYQPLNGKSFQGSGSRSNAARKGVPNPNRKPEKKAGKQKQGR